MTKITFLITTIFLLSWSSINSHASTYDSLSGDTGDLWKCGKYLDWFPWGSIYGFITPINKDGEEEDNIHILKFETDDSGHVKSRLDSGNCACIFGTVKRGRSGLYYKDLKKYKACS